VKLTRSDREVDDVSDCGDKNSWAFLTKPSADRRPQNYLAGYEAAIIAPV